MNNKDAANSHSDSELLARIDERTSQLIKDMQEIKATHVTKSEFLPIKNIVNGLVGAILLSVLSAIIALIIRT